MNQLVRLAYDWAVRSFGTHNTNHLPMRALRLAEEAIELAQAHGLPKEKMQHLVDVVYSRPIGNPYKELGGVLMCVNVMSAAQKLDPEGIFADELNRCLSKTPEFFFARNRDKIEMGLDA